MASDRKVAHLLSLENLSPLLLGRLSFHGLLLFFFSAMGGEELHTKSLKVWEANYWIDLLPKILWLIYFKSGLVIDIMY